MLSLIFAVSCKIYPKKVSILRTWVEFLNQNEGIIVRVLIFPPFSNFRRYLIHQVVETQFQNLKSFSIGEGETRRTVVCFRKDYRSIPAESSDVCLCNTSPKIISDQPVVESVRDSIEKKQKPVKKPRTMPSVSIYRPPAARKLEQNANIQTRDVVGTSSPVKNKLKASEDSKDVIQTGKRSENDGMSVFRSAITSIREQNKVPKCKTVVENQIKKNDVESKASKPEEVKSTNQSKRRRPDIQVYVPKGRRSIGSPNDTKKAVPPVCEEKPCKGPEVDVAIVEDNDRVNCVQQKTATSDCQEKQPPAESPEGKDVSKPLKSKITPEDTQNVSSAPTNSNKTSNSEKKLSAVKNTCSDSENHSENKGVVKVERTPLNPEEDDWESMFDDTGECLDPSLLAQLTNEVGEVTLEKPKSSYNGYKTKSLDTVADEFPHVIEIYNFPPEFQLHDLMMVFSQFKNSGFEIKWVDDTHALGIFSSSAIVSEVLDFYHPFVKVRSLKEGTILSKMAARRSAEFLLPYKPRPETCSALARRLVTGALGVRLPTSRQEREAEKQILTKARERKRLEAKQKEDAWEGTFS